MIRYRYQVAADQVQKAFDFERPYAQAATSAMKEWAEQTKSKVRSHIRSVGFSEKWANAFRADVFPDRPGAASMKPAVLFYSNIKYAGVYEEGATITPRKNLLWIPMSSAFGGRSGRRLMGLSGLFTVKRPGKKPMLARRIGKRTEFLFVGISSTTIRKRTDIYKLIESETNSFESYLTKNMRD